MKRFFAFLPVIGLALASNAEANPGFDVAAQTCVPDATTIGNALYTAASGYLTFAPGKSGTAFFACSIPHQTELTTPSAITMTYADSSSSDSGDGVEFALYKTDKNTGALSLVKVVPSSICTQDGNVHKCSQGGYGNVGYGRLLLLGRRLFVSE